MPPDTDPLLTATPDVPDAPSGAAPSGSGTSVSGLKAELDIDDAPFLKEPAEEKRRQKPVEAPRTKKKEKETPAGGLLKSVLKSLLADKKRLAMLSGGLVCALVILPLALMLVPGWKKGSDSMPRQQERIVVSGVPEREEAPPGPKFLYRLASFFIERRGSEGELRFLRCALAIPTDDPGFFAELGAKDVAVRDAIYYYLRNKPLAFLADKKSREMLKQDLLSVINEQLSSENANELYFEEYLITGS